MVARAQGLGGFDVNIRPRTAEVWVDGRFIGLAHDLDGYPSYLWLEEGDHTVAVSKGGFETWEQDVSVSAGVVNEMKLELRPGVAEAPREDERDRE